MAKKLWIPLSFIFFFLASWGLPQEVQAAKCKPPMVCPKTKVKVSGCPAGKMRSVDTRGHCCWPQQTYSKLQKKCVGIPSRCPRDLVPTLSGCVPDPCPTGKVRNIDTGKHCCWPGQIWHKRRRKCVGQPTECLPPLIVKEEECVHPTLAPCPAGKERSADTGDHCCWPGQVYSELQGMCKGTPSRCAAPLVPKDEACVQPGLAACPFGKTRTEDTGKRCCWPGQAFAKMLNRCVGKPTRCPAGHDVTAEGCTRIKAKSVWDDRLRFRVEAYGGYSGVYNSLRRKADYLPNGEGQFPSITGIVHPEKDYGEWVGGGIIQLMVGLGVKTTSYLELPISISLSYSRMAGGTEGLYYKEETFTIADGTQCKTTSTAGNPGNLSGNADGYCPSDEVDSLEEAAANSDGTQDGTYLDYGHHAIGLLASVGMRFQLGEHFFLGADVEGGLAFITPFIDESNAEDYEIYAFDEVNAIFRVHVHTGWFLFDEKDWMVTLRGAFVIGESDVGYQALMGVGYRL